MVKIKMLLFIWLAKSLGFKHIIVYAPKDIVVGITFSSSQEYIESIISLAKIN